MLVPKVQTRTEHPFQSLSAFFASIGSSPFSFSVDNAVGGQFVSPNGFVYEVPAFTFANAWNQPVSGTVKIRVTELTDKRSLFYSGYSSLSDRCLLHMLYGIDLQIVQEPQLLIRPVQPICIRLPFGKKVRWSDVGIYEKQAAKVHLLQGGNRSVWARASINLLVHKNGVRKEAYFYTFGPGAYLMGKTIKPNNKAKQRAMISVALDQERPQLSHVRAYLIFHESDAIVQLEEQRGHLSAFHLPKGKKASLLLLGLEQGQFYLHRYFLGPLSNQRIECRLQPISSHRLQVELQRMIF